MKEANMDRRVRKTRRVLRQCLTTLLKEKKIQEITVREIAEMADINRGTFYLHYKDVYDLMEQIENELMAELEEVLNHHSVQDLMVQPSLIFKELYPMVQKNSDIISLLMGQNGDLSFVNRLQAILRERFVKHWQNLNNWGDPDSLEAYSSFIVTGCIGVVQYWLDSGMREGPEHMAALTEHFILKGIGGLEKKEGIIDAARREHGA